MSPSGNFEPSKSYIFSDVDSTFPIFVIEVCQTSFLSHLKVTSRVSYLHCIGCCQVLVTKLHCGKNAFCQLSIKSESFLLNLFWALNCSYRILFKYYRYTTKSIEMAAEAGNPRDNKKSSNFLPFALLPLESNASYASLPPEMMFGRKKWFSPFQTQN